MRWRARLALPALAALLLTAPPAAAQRVGRPPSPVATPAPTPAPAPRLAPAPQLPPNPRLAPAPGIGTSHARAAREGHERDVFLDQHSRRERQWGSGWERGAHWAPVCVAEPAAPTTVAPTSPRAAGVTPPTGAYAVPKYTVPTYTVPTYSIPHPATAPARSSVEVASGAYCNGGAVYWVATPREAPEQHREHRVVPRARDHRRP